MVGRYSVPGPAEGLGIDVGLRLIRTGSVFFGGVGAANQLTPSLNKLVDALYGDLPKPRLASFREPLLAAMVLNLPLVRSLAEKIKDTDPANPRPVIDFEDPPLEAGSNNIEIKYRPNPREPLVSTMDDDAFIRMWLTTLISGNGLLGQVTEPSPSDRRIRETSVVFERLSDNRYRISVKGVRGKGPDLSALRRHLTADPKTLMAPISRRIGPGAEGTKINFVISYLAPLATSSSSPDDSPESRTKTDMPPSIGFTASNIPGVVPEMGTQAIFLSVPRGRLKITTGSGRIAEIFVNDFAMMATPITQVLWREIAKLINAEKSRNNDPDQILTDPSNFKGNTRPVESVSLKTVLDWIEGLNKLSKDKANILRELIPDHMPGDMYALPTEDQWNYVLSLQFGSPFSLDSLSEVYTSLVAWYKKNSIDTTHPVGKKQAISGFYDLLGNVTEFTGSVNMALGTKYLLPGGSWADTNRELSTSTNERLKDISDPETGSNRRGFRLVRVLEKL